MNFANIPPAKQRHVITWINSKAIPNASKDNLNWLSAHSKIADWIEANYSNVNTKKAHYTTLAFMTRDIFPDASEAYRKKSVELANVNTETEKKQEFDCNEQTNWKSFDQIVKRREELYNSWRATPYNRTLNFQYLALALYTKQPPIRTEYRDMPIVDKIDDPSGNYLLQTDKNDYFLFINNDKVSGSHAPLITRFTPALAADIQMSLDEFPREYLFTHFNNTSRSLSAKSFSNLLTSIFPESEFGVKNLRSAFITEYYSHPHTIAEKEHLALQMRHSKNIAELSYQKVNKCEDKKSKKSAETAKKSIVAAASKRYYEANKAKILRKKIIKNLNEKGTAPSKEMIEKYDLTYDKASKHWY